jgi:hypothetical protein
LPSGAVERERRAIEVLAAKLIRHGHLTGDEVAVIM